MLVSSFSSSRSAGKPGEYSDLIDSEESELRELVMAGEQLVTSCSEHFLIPSLVGGGGGGGGQWWHVGRK